VSASLVGAGGQCGAFPGDGAWGFRASPRGAATECARDQLAEQPKGPSIRESPSGREGEGSDGPAVRSGRGMFWVRPECSAPVWARTRGTAVRVRSPGLSWATQASNPSGGGPHGVPSRVNGMQGAARAIDGSMPLSTARGITAACTRLPGIGGVELAAICGRLRMACALTDFIRPTSISGQRGTRWPFGDGRLCGQGVPGGADARVCAACWAPRGDPAGCGPIASHPLNAWQETWPFDPGSVDGVFLSSFVPTHRVAAPCPTGPQSP